MIGASSVCQYRRRWSRSSCTGANDGFFDTPLLDLDLDQERRSQIHDLTVDFLSSSGSLRSSPRTFRTNTTRPQSRTSPTAPPVPSVASTPPPLPLPPQLSVNNARLRTPSCLPQEVGARNRPRLSTNRPQRVRTQPSSFPSPSRRPPTHRRFGHEELVRRNADGGGVLEVCEGVVLRRPAVDVLYEGTGANFLLSGLSP